MSYRKGAKLEYWIKKKLEKKGYYVIRSAGSHGVADLIAVKPAYFPTPHPIVYFIQASYRPKPASEIKKLIGLCNSLLVTPCLIFKSKGRFRLIIGSEIAEYLDTKRLKETTEE